MEEFDLLKKLGRVKAPPDFEQKVMAQLALRKERKSHRLKYFRLSFVSLAGAVAAALIIVCLNVFVLQKKGPLKLEGLKEKEDVPTAFQAEKNLIPREAIAIIESVDYSHEVRSLSDEPETIYILEQVSDIAHKGIKY